MNIEPIEQRPADALLMARHHRWRTTAVVRGIALVTTGAGI